MSSTSTALTALAATLPLIAFGSGSGRPAADLPSSMSRSADPAIPWLDSTTDPELPCLVDSIDPSDLARQGERVRLGFGLSANYRSDGTEGGELFGAQFTEAEFRQVLMQLDYQNQAAIYEPSIVRAAGESYAGLKICHARGGVVQILLKRTDAEGDPSERRALQADVARAAGGAFPLEFRDVDYSLNDLEHLRLAVEGARADYYRASGSAIRSIQVDVEHNQLRVGVEGDLSTDELASSLEPEADFATSKLWSDGYPISLFTASENVQPEVNVDMMRAGNQISRVQDVSRYCTSAVTLGFAGSPETLTSGHCIGWNALSSQPWMVPYFAAFGQESRNYFRPGSTRDLATITQDKNRLANCIQMTAGAGGICKPAVGAKNAPVNGIVTMSGANNNTFGPLSIGWVTRGVIWDYYLPPGQPDIDLCINGYLGERENCHVEPVMEASYSSAGGDSGAPVYGVTPSGFNPVFAGVHKGRAPLNENTARFVPWSEIWYATNAHIWALDPAAHIPG